MRKNEIIKKINSYVKINYRKINNNDFILGKLNYNHKCHLNSIQQVKEEHAKEVILCYCINKIDETMSIVHFINMLADETFQDNTLGWIQDNYDYYIIKRIDDSEYSKITDILLNAKQVLFDTCANWFDKYILKVDYNII